MLTALRRVAPGFRSVSFFAAVVILASCNPKTDKPSGESAKASASPEYQEVISTTDARPAVALFEDSEIDSNVDKSELANYAPLELSSLSYAYDGIQVQTVGFTDETAKKQAIAEARDTARVIVEHLSQGIAGQALAKELKSGSGSGTLDDYLTMFRHISPNYNWEGIDLSKSSITIYRGPAQELGALPYMGNFPVVAQTSHLTLDDIDYVEYHEYQVSHVHNGRNKVTFTCLKPKGKPRFFVGGISSNQIMYREQ